MWQIYGEKVMCGTKGGLVSGWKQSKKTVSNNEWREVSRGHSSQTEQVPFEVKDRISRSLEYDRERRNDRLWQKMVIDFHLVVSLPLCQ